MVSSLIPLQKLGQITQGVTPKRYADEEGICYPIISVKDLDRLLLDKTQARTRLTLPNPAKYQLKKDDVVIAIRGSLLKSSVVTDELQGCLSNQNTVFFRADSEAINPVYLAALLCSGYAKKLPSFKKMGSTTTLPAIRIGDLRSLEIPLPELTIQHEISKLFMLLDKFIQATSYEIKTRQSLAQVALFKAVESLN